MSYQELSAAIESLNAVRQKHLEVINKYEQADVMFRANHQAMVDWLNTFGHVEFNDLAGQSHQVPTMLSLIEAVQGVNPNPHTMTKSHFDGLCIHRKSLYSGSGVVNWGANIPLSSLSTGYINKCTYARYDAKYKNQLLIGYKQEPAEQPQCVVDGVLITLNDGVARDATGGYESNRMWKQIPLPEAPDATKTIDYLSGVVTAYDNVEDAFAAETNDIKVIKSRKDYIFLEVWHEKISNKDIVYPLGNVQYLATDYKGIALSANLIDPKYSAFGDWDTQTTGYGAKWSTLTTSQKAILLGESKHNIYFDPDSGVYIQVRYRVRVIKGVSDEWRCYAGYTHGGNNIMRHVRTGTPFDLMIKPRGQSISTVDYFTDGTSDDVAYCGHTSRFAKMPTRNNLPIIKGQFCITRYKSSGEDKRTNYGYKGRCFALPIALVQRYNKGAYHPSYNPMGTAGFKSTTQSNGHEYWYSATAHQPNTPKDCFLHAADSGSVSTGLSGREGKFLYHDVIYEGLAENLIFDVNKQGDLLEDGLKRAISNELCSQDMLPILCVSGGFTISMVESKDNNTLEIEIDATGDSTHEFSYRYNSDTVYVCGQDGEIIPIHLGSSAYEHIALHLGADRSFIKLGTDPNIDIVTELLALVGKTCHLVWSGQSVQTYPDGSLKEPVTSPPLPEQQWFLPSSHILYQGVSATIGKMTMCDVVGKPAKIAAYFPNGLVGAFIPKLPDGTNQSFPLSRKAMDFGEISYLQSTGDGWVKQQVPLSDEENSITISSLHSDAVVLNWYTSSAAQTTKSWCKSVINVSPMIYVTSSNKPEMGCILHQGLFGSVPTGSGQEHLSVMSHALKSQDRYDVPATHSNINIETTSGPALKTIYSTFELNGFLYLQFNATETKSVSGSWGDDGKIEIVDNEKLSLHWSGAYLKTVCHQSKFPIGIA